MGFTSVLSEPETWSVWLCWWWWKLENIPSWGWFSAWWRIESFQSDMIYLSRLWNLTVCLTHKYILAQNWNFSLCAVNRLWQQCILQSHTGKLSWVFTLFHWRVFYICTSSLPTPNIHHVISSNFHLYILIDISTVFRIFLSSTLFSLCTFIIFSILYYLLTLPRTLSVSLDSFFFQLYFLCLLLFTFLKFFIFI